MEKEKRLRLLQISTRLIEWVDMVELDPGPKREFLKIMHDLGKEISWQTELKLQYPIYAPIQCAIEDFYHHHDLRQDQRYKRYQKN